MLENMINIENKVKAIKREAEALDIISKTADIYCYGKENRDSCHWGIAEVEHEAAEKAAANIIQLLDELSEIVNQMLAEDTEDKEK